jgi:hypothetical protein
VANDIFFNVEHEVAKGMTLAVSPMYPFANIWDDHSDNLKAKTLATGQLAFPPGSNGEFFTLNLSLWDETSDDARIRISCGAANALGSAIELRLPWAILNEAYQHYNFDYPNELSQRTEDKKVAKLFDAHMS